MGAKRTSIVLNHVEINSIRSSDMAERASADQATLACDALTIYPLIGLAVLRLQT